MTRSGALLETVNEQRHCGREPSQASGPIAFHSEVTGMPRFDPRNPPVVLAVDDDTGVLRIIESVLMRHEIVVRTAGSGEEALKILKDLTPAVMILDVMMPGISGYDLCCVVKREPRLSSVPVIFLTSKASPKDFKTGHELGAVIYMVKPVKPERLVNIVQMLAPVSA